MSDYIDNENLKPKQPENEYVTNDMLKRASIDRDELVTPDKDSVTLRDIRNFRIYQKGELLMNAGSTTTSVNHDLGYVPAFMAFGYPSAFTTLGWYALPYFVQDGVNNPRIAVSVNDTTLSFLRTFSNGTLKILYYIFRESAK